MWIVEFKNFRNEWHPCRSYIVSDPRPNYGALAVFSTRAQARDFKYWRALGAEGIKYRERKIVG